MLPTWIPAVVVLATLCLTHPPPVGTKRVLLLPYSFTSHARQMVAIGEGLVDNGHEVYMVLTSSFPDMHLFENGKVKLLTHATPLRDFYQVSEEETMAFMSLMLEMRNVIATWRINIPMLQNVVQNQLTDDEYYQKLKELQFDLAIVDTFPMSRCLLVVPYNLGIPYIAVSTMQEPWLTRNPALPSFVPSNMFTGEYTPRMNFWQRLNNLWMTVQWNASPRVTYLEDHYVQKFIRDNRPLETINGLVAKCMLVFMDSDPVLDYARPLMPHEIQIAGLTTKPGKTVSGDLAEFMDSSPAGVIIMTFGSFGFGLDPVLVNHFVEAFREIKYNIVWKYVQEPRGLPRNVKVAKWLPQNDLLAHRNTKLFITHCGNNGQMEALYHGVPMIGFPIFGDQMYNCERLPYHGYGVCINPLNFKAMDLVDAVNTVMSNISYGENIKRASAIFKDRPQGPHKRALYWVEHVMKYGGTHLHSHALDMPWYQYLMLDIAAFVILVLFSLIAFLSVLVYIAFKPSGAKPHNQTHEKQE